VLTDGSKLGFLRKGNCFWTIKGFFGMLPHNSVLLAEIIPDDLFSVEVCRQLSLLFNNARTPLSGTLYFAF
jgi:hypothetical protein